jgi:hypothetical protein
MDNFSCSHRCTSDVRLWSGARWCSNTGASRSSWSASRANLCLKRTKHNANTCTSVLSRPDTLPVLCLERSKHKTTSFDAILSRAVHWQNWGTPGTIQLMDPNVISKVMQEMGRKGGKKGGKKGAKKRAESLTPEQRSQIARKAAKTRWLKAKKKGKKS